MSFIDGSFLSNSGPDGQEECIKKPISAYGSILLEELVDIMSVTEHLIANSIRINHREIRTFSDSQAAVGIITLN